MSGYPLHPSRVTFGLAFLSSFQKDIHQQVGAKSASDRAPISIYDTQTTSAFVNAPILPPLRETRRRAFNRILRLIAHNVESAPPFRGQFGNDNDEDSKTIATTDGFDSCCFLGEYHRSTIAP